VPGLSLFVRQSGKGDRRYEEAGTSSQEGGPMDLDRHDGRRQEWQAAEATQHRQADESPARSLSRSRTPLQGKPIPKREWRENERAVVQGGFSAPPNTN